MKTIKTLRIIMTAALTLIAAIVFLSATCGSPKPAETAAPINFEAYPEWQGADAAIQDEPEETEARLLRRSEGDGPPDFDAYQEEYQLRNWEEIGPLEPPAHWATAYAAANVRLRTVPNNRGDNIILTIPKGSRLAVTRRGPYQTIDGIQEPWFQVVTEDGVSGWAYSGYLAPGGGPAPRQWASVYTATANARLRSQPEAGKDNIILTVPEGGTVELIRLGPTETIDGIRAPWFAVHARDAPPEPAATGWVFSGYLTPLGEPATAGTRDYSKLLSGDFSDFTQGTWGERGERLRPDGTFNDGETATLPRRHSNGTYTWGIYNEDGGVGVILWPAGVEINVNGIFPSDTTKVRMDKGHEVTPGRIMYYQE